MIPAFSTKARRARAGNAHACAREGYIRTPPYGLSRVVVSPLVFALSGGAIIGLIVGGRV
jgi:hypothetical protein